MAALHILAWFFSILFFNVVFIFIFNNFLKKWIKKALKILFKLTKKFLKILFFDWEKKD